MRKEAEGDNDSFGLTNLTKGKLPRLPFVKVKEEILGKKYELSLAFIGSKHSKELNKILRGKEKPANVLSFPLSKNSGEILIDLSMAKKEFGKKESELKKRLIFLLIHGLLHLKGMAHGSRMEKEESRLLKKFNLF